MPAPMSSLPLRQVGLQVLTASALLTQSEITLTPPLLITQVDSAAIVRQLAAMLQAHFPNHYPVSLLELAAPQPSSTEITLNDLGQQSSLSYPVNVYLPEISSPALAAVQALVEVVAQLRSPQGGCPWDLAQTPESLVPYVIEEAYEVVDAIQSGDQKAIAEELGDLLLQVVLQAQIASEQNEFTLSEIAQGITQKLVRRHPHVFGETVAQTVNEVHRNWEQIKAMEKGDSLLSQKLSRYAQSLPPLIAGMKISDKAAAAGFEWPDVNGVWAKFHEELAEFQQSLEQDDKAAQQSELGDLLFTVINLARWYQINPFEALRGTNQRFIQRLAQMEAIADQPLSAYTLEELEVRWQQAKQQLKQSNQKNEQANRD